MKEIKSYRENSNSLVMYQDAGRFFTVQTNGKETNQTFPSLHYKYASRHYDRMLSKMRGTSV